MTDKPAMTIEQIAEQITGNCTCDYAFESRGLIDPQCVRHECYEDIVKALTEAYARGRRDMGDAACDVVLGQATIENDAQCITDKIRALIEKEPTK